MPLDVKRDIDEVWLGLQASFDLLSSEGHTPKNTQNCRYCQTLYIVEAGMTAYRERLVKANG